MVALSFSDDVQNALRTAGWTLERRGDISDWQKMVSDLAIPISEVADDIMLNLSGLIIHSEGGPIHFGVLEPLWLMPEHTPYLTKIVNEPLCPLCYGRRMFLLVSASGRFILLHDEWLQYIEYPCLNDALRELFFVVNESPRIWLDEEQRPPGYQD